MSVPAIISFATTGQQTAEQIASLTGGVHHRCGPKGEDAKALLPVLFRAGTPIIGVCAAGILIRLLAPHLSDKREEPPLIAVAAGGAWCVPLLGGHRGANQLARRIAVELGGAAALTTASDTRFAFALDEPPQGYALANPKAAKKAMTALLGGARIALEGKADWLEKAGYPIAGNGAVKVRISEAAGAPPDEALVFYPKTLVAGAGCERGTEAHQVINLIEKALADANLAVHSLAALATIDIKADEMALITAARHFGVPLRLFSASELAAEERRLANPSETVRAETGTPGVAEAAALKAGSLLVPKQKSKRATCAIGIASEPLAVEGFGRPPGRLHIAGIGPGTAGQRTASAVTALRGASDWVGYGLYLDLIGDIRTSQNQHRFGLGDEEKRVRFALELAAGGAQVALVSSGDAQIYAMAALVFELLETRGPRALSDAARRVAIECHPGISALQMASARAGALIGHDFCAISLSDLMTKRQTILERLGAAARADFVTALYNPRSGRRTELIEMAKEIFLTHRPDRTPVIVAQNLGRPGERVDTTTLARLDPQSIDMLSIVLIGASTSRAFVRGNGKTVAFTPRGYGEKGTGETRAGQRTEAGQ